MKPALSAFAGHVPANFTTKFPNANISRSPNWANFNKVCRCTGPEEAGRQPKSISLLPAVVPCLCKHFRTGCPDCESSAGMDGWRRAPRTPTCSRTSSWSSRPTRSSSRSVILLSFCGPFAAEFPMYRPGWPGLIENVSPCREQVHRVAAENLRHRPRLPGRHLWVVKFSCAVGLCIHHVSARMTRSTSNR